MTEEDKELREWRSRLQWKQDKQNQWWWRSILVNHTWSPWFKGDYCTRTEWQQSLETFLSPEGLGGEVVIDLTSDNPEEWGEVWRSQTKEK